MNRVLQTRVLRSFLVHRTVTASVSTPCASSTRPAAWRSDRLVATSASSSADATTDTGAQRVVVIGGGFGGLYAAIRLSSLFWPKGKTPQITVVDKGDRFTFKPLLYELLNGSAGEDEVAPRFEQLLAPYPIRFIQAQVVGVDESEEGSSTGHAGTTGGVVQLEGGASVEYDWLVVGLGSTADARGVPGVKELALSFNVYDDAVVVKAALEQIEAAGDPSQAVMIVGAGYAGVELATVVAERLGGAARVQLVTPADNILDGCPPGQRDAALRVLAQLGVEVLPRTRVLEVSRAPDQSSPVSTAVSVSLSNSVDAGPRDVPAAAVLWTAGATPATQVPAQRKGLPFPVSRRGAVVIEPTLRVAGHPQVFALGDVSVNEPGGTGAPALPATAQVAFQQADYVAWNLWASLNGRTLLTFNVKDYILVARRRMHAVTDCRAALSGAHGTLHNCGADRREFNLQLSDRFGLLEAVPPEGADAQAEYDAMAAAIHEVATNHLAPRGSRRRLGWQFTLSQRILRLMDARQRAHTAWLRSKSAAAKRERNRANRAADAAVQRDRERWIGQQVAEAQDMLRKKNLRQFARACDRLAGRSRSHQIPPAMRDVSGALHSGPDGVLKAMTESFDKLYGGETKLSDETLNQLENDVAAFELTRATEVDEAHGRPPDLAETEACVRALRSAAAPGGDQLDAMLLRYQHLGSMMSLGQLNAAVALPMEVPAPIVSALQASPLGPLLGALGVRLGSDAPGGGSGDGGGVTVDGPLAQWRGRREPACVCVRGFFWGCPAVGFPGEGLSDFFRFLTAQSPPMMRMDSTICVAPVMMYETCFGASARHLNRNWLATC
ncbi:hypothetical protein FOA52_001250 [Chlamydomonas sp. UWO 241]|nr:hypothetical protein FOA52_001250 [Chlamydomonas sp. UWO 241]